MRGGRRGDEEEQRRRRRVKEEEDRKRRGVDRWQRLCLAERGKTGGGYSGCVCACV